MKTITIFTTAFLSSVLINWIMENFPPYVGVIAYFTLMILAIWLIIKYFKKSLKKKQ